MAHVSELKRSETARWWADKETFGTVLLALLIDEYSTESLEWDPETIRLQVKSDYGVEIPRVNMDKIMAMITVITTNLFDTSVEAFTQIANALNGSTADFNNWDPPTAEEAAWAISEVTMSNPPKSKDKFADQFSPDIKRYLGVICEMEGLTSPPDVLRIAELDEQNLKNADETFADDPDMYAGFYQLGQSKSEDITGYVRGRLKLLMQQLDEVPLQSRDHKSWQSFSSKQRA